LNKLLLFIRATQRSIKHVLKPNLVLACLLVGARNQDVFKRKSALSSRETAQAVPAENLLVVVWSAVFGNPNDAVFSAAAETTK
jgi:hypothetical protein